MDVVGLSKNGIENAVANLGTSLTDKQIFTLNQFFDDIIICFDGDESGYKAALRAAENSIKDLKPEKQISFLFLPDNEDPDSFVNKNGKIILLTIRHRIKFQYINLFLVIIKNKLKITHLQWQFLKKT
jgi:DNA primase